MKSIEIELKEFEVKNKLGIKDKDFIKLAKVIKELHNKMSYYILESSEFAVSLETYDFRGDLKKVKKQIAKDYVFIYFDNFSKDIQKFILKNKVNFWFEWIYLLSDLIVIKRGQ